MSSNDEDDDLDQPKNHPYPEADEADISDPWGDDLDDTEESMEVEVDEDTDDEDETSDKDITDDDLVDWPNDF